MIFYAYWQFLVHPPSGEHALSFDTGVYAVKNFFGRFHQLETTVQLVISGLQ
jgi:cell shape-determining protein MreD